MERRKQTRFKVKACFLRYSKAGLLSFLKKPDSEPQPVLNLSMGGLEFATVERMKPGQKVRIDLEVPAFDALIRLSGEVRWTAEVPARKLFKTGVRFSKVDAQTKKRLRELQEDPMIRGIVRAGRGLL